MDLTFVVPNYASFPVSHFPVFHIPVSHLPVSHLPVSRISVSRLPLSCLVQRIFISDRRVSPPLRCPEEALTQPLSALSAASYNTCPSV